MKGAVTALIIACSNGHDAVAKCLLENDKVNSQHVNTQAHVSRFLLITFMN